jgi:mRNA interferase RelE/StbE
MEVIVTKGFTKELRVVPKYVQQAVVELVKILIAAKKLEDTKFDYKKIQGCKKDENYYRIRVGNYRIGCELIQPKIILITIFHRQDDYKGFPPKK